MYDACWWSLTTRTVPLRPHPPMLATNPDERLSAKHAFPFAFDRIGVQVPALLISPYISPAIVDSTIDDRTILLAISERRFGLPLMRRGASGHRSKATLSLPDPRADASATLQ